MMRPRYTNKWYCLSPLQLALPCGLQESPVYSVTTKFVRASANKSRCPIYCISVRMIFEYLSLFIDVPYLYLVGTWWTSADHGCCQWRIHSLEWYQLQLWVHSSGNLSCLFLTHTLVDSPHHLVGTWLFSSQHDMEPQWSLDDINRWPRLRQVLAGQLEQRAHISSSQWPSAV